MSKLILKYKGIVNPDTLEWLEERIKKDLDNNGFAIIDDKFEVYELEDSEENHD